MFFGTDFITVTKVSLKYDFNALNMTGSLCKSAGSDKGIMLLSGII